MKQLYLGSVYEPITVWKIAIAFLNSIIFHEFLFQHNNENVCFLNFCYLFQISPDLLFSLFCGIGILGGSLGQTIEVKLTTKTVEVLFQMMW